MSNLLAAYNPSMSSGLDESKSYPLFIDAKADVRRMLEIVEHIGSAAPEMQKTRGEVLRKAVEAIQW